MAPASGPSSTSEPQWRVVHLRCLDGFDEPLAGWTYTVSFVAGLLRGTLPQDGRLEMRLPVGLGHCKVLLRSADHQQQVQIVVRFSDAEPSLSNEAAQGILQNLGFYSGPIDGRMAPRLKEAIEEFQCFYGLEITGEVDQQTWARMTSKGLEGTSA